MPRLVRVALGSSEVDSRGQLQPPSLSWITGTKNPFVCHMLRFLAHFILFVRTMEPGIPDPPCAQILKSYLSVLMADHRTDLVANYAAMLHDSNARIDWYSSFLVGITDPSEREHCLSLALSAGFDVQRLTRSVVRLLRERQLLPSQQQDSATTDTGVAVSEHTHANAIERARLASLLQEDNPDSLSELDRRRIASLDWLFYDPRQRGEVLIAANSLLRTFIAMNCLKAAEQIINRLPEGTLARAKIICEDTGSPEWLVNTIREHECLVLYLESQEAFADWLKQSQSKKPTPPSELSSQSISVNHANRALTERLRVEELRKQYDARMQRWRHLLRLDTEVASEKLLALLNYPSPGWLVDVTSCPHKASDMSDHPISCIKAPDGTGDTTTNLSPSPMFVNPELAGLGDSPNSRLLQMQVLRESCLSSAVSLLIRLYQTAGMHKECVELSNLIVSKQHGLFKLFSRVQIRQLFDRFKESFEYLVAVAGDPLGYGSNMADLSAIHGTISDAGDLESVLRNCSLEAITQHGWVLSQPNFDSCVSRITNPTQQEVFNFLLDVDLRDVGSAWFQDCRSQDSLEANGRIAQIVRIRNLAIPQAEEDETSSSSGGPRFLRLILTDGRSILPAVDLDNNDKLGLNTPPGTKLRLIGTLPVQSGFVILSKSHTQYLGGHVPNLIKEWTMTKNAKSLLSRHATGAPPFVPFGTTEAYNLVQTESHFLRSLRSTRTREDTYDSFKIASSANILDKENEVDTTFLDRRKDVIAELKKTTIDEPNNGSLQQGPSRRFQAGGSKFSDLQAAKMQAHDESLSRLASLGYPIPLASTALKAVKGDFQAALDYLMAKQMSKSKLTASNGPSRSARGGSHRRRGRGRGDFDTAEEDDPRFDPNAAAIASGLSVPSAGLVRLSDLMPSSVSVVHGKPANDPCTSGPSSSYNTTTPILPVGCPVLAQNMQGTYEEAQLLGYLSYFVNGSAPTDKVVLVVYRREHNGHIEEEEELVPVSLIRSLNKQRITIEMVPPAPPDRAKPYTAGQNLSNFTTTPDPTFHSNLRRPHSRARGGRTFRSRSFGRRGFRGSRFN